MKKFLELVLCAFFVATPAFAVAAKFEPFFTAKAIKGGGLGKEDLALILEGKAPPVPLNAPKDTLLNRLGMLMSDKFGFNRADGFSPADLVKVIRASDVVACGWEMGQVKVDSLDKKDKNLIHVFDRLPYEGEKCLSYKGVQYISLRSGNTLSDNRPVKPAPVQSGEVLAEAGAKAPVTEAAAKPEGTVVERTITFIPGGVPTEVPVIPRYGNGVRSFYLSVCSGGWCPQTWAPYGYGYYGGFGWGGWGGWNQIYSISGPFVPNTIFPQQGGNGSNWGQTFSNSPAPPPSNITLPIGGNGNSSGWGNMSFPGLGVQTR